MADTSVTPAFAPRTPITTHAEQIGPGISLVNPLTQRGHGPGLIVLVSQSGILSSSSLVIKDGVPAPVMKWAEEGYAVVEVTKSAILEDASGALQTAASALAGAEKCNPKDAVGLIAYHPSLWNEVAASISLVPVVKATVVYADVTSQLAPSSVPTIHHLAGKPAGKLQRDDNLTAYDYSSAKAFDFATPFTENFLYNLESVSHTRNLTFLKRRMNGPYFDLEYIWDEHTYWEFENRSVENTMATMVQEPYVNHVPTLTGGVGREKLTAFYRDNFIFKNSADTELELISRSVGIDRIIDEFIFKCTHDSYIDWLVPGVPPTGKKLEIPFTAVVNIRGDRLYHEHIAWDQATVLVQLGLLPEYLPYSDGSGKKLEYRVPTTGVDTAGKLRDRESVPSNEMFKFMVREVKD